MAEQVPRPWPGLVTQEEWRAAAALCRPTDPEDTVILSTLDEVKAYIAQDLAERVAKAQGRKVTAQEHPRRGLVTQDEWDAVEPLIKPTTADDGVMITPGKLATRDEVEAVIAEDQARRDAEADG